MGTITTNKNDIPSDQAEKGRSQGYKIEKLAPPSHRHPCIPSCLFLRNPLAFADAGSLFFSIHYKRLADQGIQKKRRRTATPDSPGG